MPPRIRYERLERKIRLYSTITSLTGIAGRIAEDARGRAKTARMKQAISVGSAEQDENGVRISIIVDISEKTGAPEAAAYEYGSGIHRTKGAPAKYRIPREGGGAFVAFPLEKWPQYRPPPNKKYHWFPFVMHPGVAPEPFLQPAIAAHMDELKSALGKAFKEDILESMPRFEKIS